MNLIYFFLFGVLFSAIGATAPGLINLAVAERTIKRGFRPGVMVAFGASVTEFLYTFIAIFFIDVIIKNAVIGQSIRWIAVFVFIGLGVFYLIKKPGVVKTSEVGSSRKHFGYGSLIAAMNMLIIPTWIFLGLWLRSNGFDFRNLLDILFLSLGSAAGAFLVFLGYVYLGKYIVDKIENISRYTNKALGFIFLSLATVQLIRLYYYP
jgi:threonine/homoserine/homoserine lactone efflux protein